MTIRTQVQKPDSHDLAKPMAMMIRVLCASLAILGAGLAHAQTYPSKPVTIIVPFAVGSAADQVARGVAQILSAGLPNNPTVVIDNKPGASGMIAAQAAARAAADGHTLFYTTNTTQSANQHLFKKLSYDPVNDFAPITAIATGAMILAVPMTSPVKSMADFISLARRRDVNYGAGNSSSRLAGEMFRQMTGTNLTFVPYKSNPQAIADLVGGQLDAMFADTASAMALIKADKLRPIAFTGSQRTPSFPNLPTIDELGIKGYSLTYWGAMYAPRGAPREIIQLLNALIVQGVKSEPFKAVISNAALDVFTSTPEELGAFQVAEAQRWGRVIKAAGIEPE